MFTRLVHATFVWPVLPNPPELLCTALEIRKSCHLLGKLVKLGEDPIEEKSGGFTGLGLSRFRIAEPSFRTDNQPWRRVAWLA